MFTLLRTKNLISLFIYLVPLLVCIYCYWPGMSGYMVIDDHWNIADNHNLRIETLDIQSFKRAMLSGQSGPLKRPVAMLSFGINYYFTKLEPFWMKITNFMFHILSGFILLLVLKKIFEGLVSVYGDRYSYSFIPHLIAFAWLIHPIHVTAISYIVQRMTSLSSLFMLLCIYCYLLLRTNKLSNSKRYFLFIGMLISWVLGIFTKEIAILTGLIIVVLESFLFKFRSDKLNDKLILYSSLCILCIPVVLGFVYVCLNYQKYFINDYILFRDFTVWERLLTQTRLLVYYASLILIPKVNSLGVYQDGVQLSKSLIEPFSTIISISIILSCWIIAWKIRKKFPLAALGVAWFCIMHLLESTVISLELAFLHRNYLASVGILFILAEILISMAKIKKKYVTIAVSLYLILFASTTRSVSWNWSNDMVHIMVDSLNYPESARANSNVGILYYVAATHSKTIAEKQKLIDKAYFHFEKVFDIRPKIGHVNYFLMLKSSAEKGVNYPDDLIDRIISSLDKSIVSYEMLKSLEKINFCLMKEVCSISVKDYKRILEKVGEMNFYSASFMSFYHNVHASFLFNIEKDYMQAIKAQEKAVNAFPEYPDHYINLFIYYRQIPKIHSMEMTLNKLIELDKYNLFADKISNFKTDIMNARAFIKEYGIDEESKISVDDVK